MALNQNMKDLEWCMQLMKSGTLNLHTVSFFLSQPTTFCNQETENSININITNQSLSYFSQFLQVLAETNSPLQNLEFHLVKWDLQQLKHLQTLLQTNSCVKQLVFKRNKFNADCLSELFNCLSKNTSLKELIMLESGIGSYGVTLLASALKENSSLEELKIWADSVGSKGAEELSKMIEVNSTLKMLTVFDSKSYTATPLISAVLARNRCMEVHVWCLDRSEKIREVLEFAPEKGALRINQLDVSGTCRVACALGWNSTVTSLDLNGVRLKSRWGKEFRWVLEQTRTLKEVNLSKTCMKDKAVVYVAAGLFKNQSLETLYLDGNLFGGVGVEHFLCPLSKFSGLQSQANVTLKSVTLGGPRSKIGRDGLLAVIQMLTTNRSLTHLGIVNDKSLKPDDMVKIFKSLERNGTLRSFSLQGCKGVKGELVLETIMEMLNVNPWIQEIHLDGTPLHIAEKTDCIYERLGQTERSEMTFDLLTDLPMTTPKSCRVFLCGQEYAGKSTLCNSIAQNISPSKLPYVDQVRILVNPVEQAVRTQGMRIKSCNDEDTKISIWNLAGQHESYSVHDFLFPGHSSASFFLIISSFFKKPSNREPKSQIEIEEDLNYWLRFIVANSRRAVQQCILPNVTIVLTHHDKINQQSGNLQATLSIVQKLREKFQGFVELYPAVFAVDAKSSASVNKLSHHISGTCKSILERVPRVYQLCDELIELLSTWREENHNKPVMTWEEFNELCQVKVPSLRFRRQRADDDKEKVEMRRRAMATCLHDMGEVIYFTELEFLILDCEWFCGELLNQLMRLDIRKKSSKENTGFICRKDLERVLMGLNVRQNLKERDLVTMMLKLGLCYEQDPSDTDSPLLIPSNLEEGTWKPQKWQLDSPDCNHVGRHLQCDDSSRMILMPGFFPRLQVHLHNKIIALKTQYGASCSFEKHLISININGIYVRVELGGYSGRYIDILACSTKNHTEMLRLFQQLIIPAIQSLCQETTLTEHVLRSACVKNLTPPRYRKNQSAPLQQLKQALLSIPADVIYDYQHTWDSVTDSGNTILEPGFDYARDLLSDDDFREVLHCRYNDLHNLAMELQTPNEDEQGNPSSSGEEITSAVEPTFAGIAKGVEAVLQRLKIIEQEIRDVKQEIQGLRYYEHRLLIQLHHKVNYLVNYNTQIEERKVPNMFYFVQTENYSRRLITTVISGMNALRLHMLCEYRREMHVVDDQIGCEIMHVDNITVKCIAPYMTKFMKLVTFALKIGAHLAAGMGNLIPDLGKAVTHLVDSPMLCGAAGAAAAGVVGAVVLGNRNRGNSRDVIQDHGAAQQWVVDYLKEQGCSTGKDIAETFGLWRVRYRDDGQIAWICRRHMYARANEIVEVPV